MRPERSSPRPRVERVCLTCGTAFLVTPGEIDKGGGRFCRRACVRFDPVLSAAKFWAKVEKTNGCWPWRGARTTDGYGYLLRGGKKVLAHRFAWMLTNGPIPDGLLICHRCDNPPCCRPEHLFVGTVADNAADMAQKGRATKNAHQLGEMNAVAVLTDDTVRAIRALSAAGLTQADIGRRLTIKPTTVYHVVHRKTWKHVR